MGSSSSRVGDAAAAAQPSPRRGAASSSSAPPSSRWASLPSSALPSRDTGIRCICPACRSILMPPASVFRCPCGQLMMLAPTASLSSLAMSSSSLTSSLPAPRSPRASRVGPMTLDDRIRIVLDRLPAGDPNSIFLRALLERLPRRPDGTIDAAAMEGISAQINAATRGASDSLISLLPTRTFSLSSLPKNLREEHHTSCQICMAEYEEGDQLRTLPCLHAFHKGCVDTWLKSNKICPHCRFPIDTDAAEVVRRQEREDRERRERERAKEEEREAEEQKKQNTQLLQQSGRAHLAAGGGRGVGGGGDVSQWLTEEEREAAEEAAAIAAVEAEVEAAAAAVAGSPPGLPRSRAPAGAAAGAALAAGGGGGRVAVASSQSQAGGPPSSASRAAEDNVAAAGSGRRRPPRTFLGFRFGGRS